MKLRTLSLALAAALASTAIGAAQPAIAQNTSITKEQVAAVLRENPELVVEALQAAQAKQQAAQTQALAASAKPVADQVIKGDTQVAFVGDPNGKPIVEFFDYNCGFCKRFHAETATPLLAKGGTKIFMVHTPILGEGSVRMAEFAAAANLQGKFAAAHFFLIKQSAHTVAEANALMPELIAAAGLDKSKFDKSLADGTAKAQVDHNDKLSRTAGVAGTPMIYTKGQAIPGAIPLTNLEQLLAS